MASGNLIKPANAPNSTFHVTSRGVNRMDIFRCRRDKLEFLECFRRYLSPERFVDGSNRPYRKLGDEVSALALILLENHFHMLIHQMSADGMRKLMHGALSGYGRYFNDRYHRDGPIFKSRYYAEPIETNEHAKFAAAYIHLNDPIAQLEVEFSSHRCFMGEMESDWIDSDAGLAMFGGRSHYVHFMDRAGPSIVEKKLKKRGLVVAEYPYRPIDENR